MKKLYFCIAVFAVCTVLSSCKKESQSRVFYWDETRCSDPWYQVSDYTEEEKKISIENYLKDQSIDVESIEFEIDATKEEFCKACGCLSGGVVKVRVIEEDRRKMECLSFYQ